ncbi:MAG: hypothetical protein Q9167_005478 [Letrouitia subvulpina]
MPHPRPGAVCEQASAEYLVRGDQMGELCTVCPYTKAISNPGFRWLPATSDADASHCTPRPSSYDWYEYTTSWDCGNRTCDAQVINFSASNETVPYFEESYVLSTIDIGNGRLGKFGLSYFDKKGGGYAVGTKRMLSDAAAASQEGQDCKAAFKTLVEIKDEKKLDLLFDLDDICQSSSGIRGQHFLGLKLT